MILEFDLGNSRFKWRLLAEAQEGRQPADPYKEGGARPGSAVVIAGGAVEADIAAMRQVMVELGAPPRRVRGSSVASAQMEDALTQAVRSQWGIDIELAGSAAECAGVRNGYRDPARLGVDRWLALVAAYRRRGQAVLVVDAGSALTMDLVDAGGCHLGGYITPGRRLLLEGLRSSTARVRFAAADLRADGPGRDTAAAVEGGVRIALRGALREAMEIAVSRLGDFDLVLTGGDVDWLLHGAELQGASRAERVPDLVMDGLRWAVP